MPTSTSAALSLGILEGHLIRLGCSTSDVISREHAEDIQVFDVDAEDLSSSVIDGLENRRRITWLLAPWAPPVAPGPNRPANFGCRARPRCPRPVQQPRDVSRPARPVANLRGPLNSPRATTEERAMPIEMGVWRLGPLAQWVPEPSLMTSPCSVCSRRPSVLSPNLMLIGRQVPTSHGKAIDLS
jgi:hypothetical protein